MPPNESLKLIQELAADLATCRQNPLLSEVEFIQFCKKRDIPVFGANTGDPSKLHKRELLREDSRTEDGRPLYHPFRFYIVYEVLDSLRIPLARSSYLERDRVLPTLERHVREWLPSDEEISARAARASEIVELAILLEPLYWQYVTGVIVGSVFTMEEKPNYSGYIKVVKQFVKTLCPEQR